MVGAMATMTVEKEAVMVGMDGTRVAMTIITTMVVMSMIMASISGMDINTIQA
jgi:hypothetical protein